MKPLLFLLTSSLPENFIYYSFTVFFYQVYRHQKPTLELWVYSQHLFFVFKFLVFKLHCFFKKLELSSRTRLCARNFLHPSHFMRMPSKKTQSPGCASACRFCSSLASTSIEGKFSFRFLIICVRGKKRLFFSFLWFTKKVRFLRGNNLFLKRKPITHSLSIAAKEWHNSPSKALQLLSLCQPMLWKSIRRRTKRRNAPMSLL